MSNRTHTNTPGPMSPEATPHTNNPGPADQNMGVGSQVGPIVIKKVRDHAVSDAQLPAQPGPRDGAPAPKDRL